MMDRYCATEENGGWIGTDPRCMHNQVQNINDTIDDHNGPGSTYDPRIDYDKIISNLKSSTVKLRNKCDEC